MEVGFSDSRRIFGNDPIKVGSELDAESFYKTLTTIRGLQENRIKFARERTEQILKELDEVQTNVNALMLFERLSDENI